MLRRAVTETLLTEAQIERAGRAAFVRALLERMRSRGAVRHAWLDPYLASGGNRYRVWGGRPQGMPAFPLGYRRRRSPGLGLAAGACSMT